KGFDPQDIKAGWVGTARPELHGQGAQGGNSLMGQIGLAGVPCTRVENGCPTGADAIRNAAFGVASGVYDVVLAAGYEKMRDAPTTGLLGIAVQGHPLLTLGETAMTMFAPKAIRYMHEYGLTKEQMAMVAVKNRKNGVLDPYAQFRFEITVEDVLKSLPVCDPLNLLDCCPQTDGAACVLLCRADIADKYTDKPVYIAGLGCGTDYYYQHEVDSFTSYAATVRSAKEARESDPGISTLQRFTTASPSLKSLIMKIWVFVTGARERTSLKRGKQKEPAVFHATQAVG
ncbi:MAG: thiolase family protein, partial [Deltaproteobacteria bacterium]|nr:thiolase family protein [Deltaproteobacteria bacterium]